MDRFTIVSEQSSVYIIPLFVFMRNSIAIATLRLMLGSLAALLLALAITQHAWSQAKESVFVRGFVKDEEGNLLNGVSVVLKSNNKGTTTDEKGYFTLRVANANASIVVSYIGFAPQTLRVSDREAMNIVLERQVNMQEEVVVIGYGTARRRDLTGAISTYKPGQTEASQFMSVDGLMRGRVAGLTVTQAGGDPGAAASVRIRGGNSLRGDNEPLYVVDGVIISNVTADNSDPFADKTANSGQTKQSALTGINPRDIETIEVLKDASATAIYGSRGANGVIIIATKQGKGRPVITLNSTVEMASATRKLEMLDATGYATYINQIEAINNRAPRYGLDTLDYVNWQDEMMRTAVLQNYRLSVTGASQDKKTKYYLAGGFLKNDGIVEKTSMKQGDIKLNLNQELSGKLKLNFTVAGSMMNNSMTQGTEPLGGGDNSMIIKMLVGNPIENALKGLDDPTEPFDNPRAWLVGYDDLSEEARAMGALGLTYNISKSWIYKFNLAGDFRTKERKRWFGKQTFAGKNANGSLGMSQFQRSFYQVENLFLFNKRLAKGNNIDGTVGITYDKEDRRSSSVINENFFTEDLRTEGFGFGQLMYPYVRNRSEAQVFSGLARINYNLKNRYLFTASGRADGSSKFAEGNRFSYFPAAAIAWKVSEEKFMQGQKFFSNMKLRAGFGRSGSQAIEPYGTLSRYSQVQYVSGNTLIVGSVPANIQNESLKWETTTQINAGIDMGMLKNKVNLTVDVYRKQTDDLLQTFRLPVSTGFATIVKNIGTIENKGIEFTVSASLLENKDMSLVLNGNLAINRSKILDLGLPEAAFGNNIWEAYIGANVSNGTYFKDPANIFVVGKPVGLLYGYKTDGVFQTKDDISTVKQFGLPVKYGDMKLVDQNGDGDIGPSDKVIIGDPNPDFSYGFSVAYTYKDWTADVFFNGVYGNQIVNGNMFRIGNPNGNNSNNILASVYKEAWTVDNPTNNPRIGYDNLNLVDRYVEDGSFLRMATVSVGYNFQFQKSRFIKKINLSLVGKNLLTVTNYSGFDPEVNSFTFDANRMGVDWGSYPNLKSFSCVLNFTF
jgi:TonB-linked SusC/RagA family outer membrane protein